MFPSCLHTVTCIQVLSRKYGNVNHLLNVSCLHTITCIQVLSRKYGDILFSKQTCDRKLLTLSLFRPRFVLKPLHAVPNPSTSNRQGKGFRRTRLVGSNNKCLSGVYTVWCMRWSDTGERRGYVRMRPHASLTAQSVRVLRDFNLVSVK